MNVADGLLEHANRAPDRPAVVLDGDTRSYGDLGRAVDDAAAGLQASIGDRDERIGLSMAPGATFLEGFLGAAGAGMSAMVLQTGWSQRELATVLATARPALILTDPTSMNRFGRLAGSSIAVAVGDDGVGAALRHVIATAGGAEPAGDGPAAQRRGPDEQRPFYVGFTSGTTGKPKGFVRHHRSWLRSFDAASDTFGVGADDRVLVPGPLDHSLFLFAALHGLSVGAAVHLQRRFSARQALRTMASEGITTLYAVPTMLDALLTAAERDRHRLPHVSSVICSGARWLTSLDGRVRAVFPSATAFDFYGASELSFVSVRRSDDQRRHAHARGDADDGREDRGSHHLPTSVGRPFPGVEVAVRRSDGSDAAIGEAGRLWVRSDMLFTGYLDAADGDPPDAHGWATVGDVARIDATGRIHLVGREGTMLICGGLNVYPEEIESILLELPEVAEAAVVGLPHPRWGDQLCAVLRWEDGRTVERSRLRAHCRARLARGKRPQRWLSVDALPRTPGGKVARSTLADAVRAGTLPVVEVS